MKFERKFHINDNYFSIPSEENSYWAGFIAADGCIMGNKLSISLSSKDSDQLELFRKHTCCESSIRFYKNNTGKEYCNLSTYSSKVVNDLDNNFNITERKTFTLEPPNISKEDHIDYYIKGYIDGDGCVSLCNLKRGLNINIQITGTKCLLEWINKRFSQILGREAKSLRKRNNTDVYSCMYDCLSGRKLFSHFYKIDLGMERKWNERVKDFCDSKLNSETAALDTGEVSLENENSVEANNEE